MSSRCESQEDNGCSSCGPTLTLFSVGHSANYPSPPGECPVYLDSRYNSRSSSSFNVVYYCGEDEICAYRGNGSASTMSSDTTSIVEEEDGSITTTRLQTFTSSTDSKTIETCTGFIFSQNNCTNSSSVTTITKTDSCGNTTTSSSSTYNPCEGGNFVVDYVGDCSDLNPETSICNTTETCDSSGFEARSTGSGISFCGSFFNGTKFGKTIYSNPVTATLNDPNSVVDRRISRLKVNNFPCTESCCFKCGGENGKQDDCWGGFGGFSIPDSSVTISKVALKIAVEKEAFQKIYKSVSGKIYFYFGGEGTPCCTECGGPECFTGTVVKTLSYSLGGSDFREGQYLAADVGELSNTELQDYIDETIVACITVDSIEFMS
jgi:hypothetical protein